MIESLKSLYETYGFEHPGLFVATFALVGAVGGIWTGWGRLNSIRDGKGTLSGKVVLEDHAVPTTTEIVIRRNGALLMHLVPNPDGEFSKLLDLGSYSLQISAPGYLPRFFEDVNIISPKVAAALREIKLVVAPKIVTLSLVDKKGIPYSNVHVAIEKAWVKENAIAYTTDTAGKLQTSEQLISGSYYLIPGAHTVSENTFL